MALVKFGLSKVFFETDNYFVIFGPSQTYISFGMCTPYGLRMTKKEFLGIPCPKSNVGILNLMDMRIVFDLV